MKKFKFTIDGNDYNVNIQEVEGNLAKLEVNGTPYDVELHQEVKKGKTPKLVRAKVQYAADDANIKSTPSAGLKIETPLPGTIWKVLCKDGQTVKEGDTILILEAMKMENNILAEKTGVLTLKVKEGDSVLQGDVLAIIS